MGFAAGMQAGSAMAQRGLDIYEKAKLRQDLAQESERYNVTEGAYGEGLGENLQQVIGARDQALQRLSGDAYARGEEATPQERQQVIDQYTPAMAELSRRVGLQGPDYSIASGAQNFDTRQEARQAAAPMRTEGLAGVYRRSGDIEKADALEARAFDMQRGLAAEGRAVAGEKRAQTGFETQQEASLLTIEEQKRVKKQRDEDEARQKQLSKNWTDRLTVKDAEGNVTGMRPPTNEDMMWAAQSNAKSLAAAGKTTEALASFKDYMTTAKGQIELQSAERTDAIRVAADRVNRGDFDGAKDLYDKFVPDGAKVKEFKQNADGSITVKRVDLNGSPLPDTKTTKDEILKGLVSFNDPAKLIEYTQQSFMNNLRTEELDLKKKTEKRQAAEAGKSSVEKNLATLQRLGIPVSPEDVRAMAGIKQEKLSPEAAAQLEAITANLKGNESPKALAEARAAITDLFRGEGLKQRNTTIVRGLKTANSKNDLPAAIKQLQDAGVGDETIVGLAKQAGVTLPPSFAPVAAPATAPAAPAVSPRTGLSSGQQQKYGPLTPMATIEADARAGVPAAVAYLQQMADRDRAKTENAMRAAQGE
jgi:hypothetical protein